MVEVTHFFGLRRSFGTSLAPSPSLFLVSSSRQTKMEATPSQLPESYEFSQSQFTQTQPQTQPETQPGQASSTLFPSNLWGILLSSSGEASTSTSLPNGVNGGGGGTTISDRPTRFELVRPSCGGKQVYEIGRHPRSDLRMNSPKVSNSHARISISDTDGLVRLEDLSTNGTHVRGIKVSTSFSQLYCVEGEADAAGKSLGLCLRISVPHPAEFRRGGECSENSLQDSRRPFVSLTEPVHRRHLVADRERQSYDTRTRR